MRVRKKKRKQTPSQVPGAREGAREGKCGCYRNEGGSTFGEEAGKEGARVEREHWPPRVKATDELRLLVSAARAAETGATIGPAQVRAARWEDSVDDSCVMPRWRPALLARFTQPGLFSHPGLLYRCSVPACRLSNTSGRGRGRLCGVDLPPCKVRYSCTALLHYNCYHHTLLHHVKISTRQQ